MKISFITTILNEEKTVNLLLVSILSQTRKPDEIIIVDGGSKDHTVLEVKNFISLLKKKRKILIKFYVKKGNRSVGRNLAINKATGDIIVCSDAGCVLDRNWIKRITIPLRSSRTDVVAGFYKGRAASAFQESLVPYVLVMSDRANSKNFLPSSRSLAFRKSVWEKIGGFPEQFSKNEDYVFANRVKNKGFKIVFSKSSIVYWIPRENLKDAFVMFFGFAQGDVESGIFRPKVSFLFIRYLVGFWILMLYFALKLHFILNIVYIILISYAYWSIFKNYKYVKKPNAVFFLPLLQLTADFAVMLGTIAGFKKLWVTQKKR